MPWIKFASNNIIVISSALIVLMRVICIDCTYTCQMSLDLRCEKCRKQLTSVVKIFVCHLTLNKHYAVNNHSKYSLDHRSVYVKMMHIL